MENLPESLYDEPLSSASSAVAEGGGAGGGLIGNDGEPKSPSVERLILCLNDDFTRETALARLSKKRETCEDIAILLWHSFGTIFTLLKEILNVYKLLSTPDLTENHSSRVCNALALLQCVASHPDTRTLFIKARIPMYLYPLLNTTNQDRPHQCLRLTSLGVIGSLLKAHDKEAVNFLIESEVFPFCIKCMYMGNQLSKTVAAFIVHRILIHDEGLSYCCNYAERFFAVCNALRMMIETEEPPSPSLLKHIICCYLRLSESPRACESLRNILPHKLRDSAVVNILRSEPIAVSWRQQLFHNLAVGFRSRVVSGF